MGADVVTPRWFLSHSPAATEALGADLGRALGAGAVIALRGELGSGKTAFVRGLARGLDCVDPVTSPTFTLMHEYRGRLTLCHFDAWMSGREGLFLEGGGAEFLGGAGVAVVEWAERVERWLPLPRIELGLSHRDPTTRLLRLGVASGAVAGPGAEELAVALGKAVRGIEPGEGLEELDADPDGPGSD